MIPIYHLLLLFLIVTIAVCTVYVLFVFFINELQRIDRKIWHGALMLIGTTVTGVAVMIFRLLRGFRTRLVKYFHLAIQTMAVLFFIAGYIYVNNAAHDFEEFKNRSLVQEMPTAKLHIYSDVHVAVGRMTLIAFGLQYITGWLLYTCLPISSRVRILTAPIHDVFGLWIFLCLISALVTGVYMLYDMTLGYRMVSNVKYGPVLYMNIMFAFLFGAAAIVFIAVISPFFDWELVGNI